MKAEQEGEEIHYLGFGSRCTVAGGLGHQAHRFSIPGGFSFRRHLGTIFGIG